jgi:two-component system, NarL family, response regulator NreC
MKLRVVVADDHPGFLDKLTLTLKPEFDLLATAVDGKSALECIRRCQPDVVVLDLEMPGLNGLEVTKELAKHPPSPAVVICSAMADPEIIAEARHAGALGYVSKRKIAKDLIEAVESVARGQSFVSAA